jgi:hypothetical protein
MFEQQIREIERTLLPSNKATYEREKESIFSSFRRACLNVSDAVLLQTTPAQVAAIWRLLLDVARTKLRRKHVLECARILTRVRPFLDLLLHDPDLDRSLRALPQDFVKELNPGRSAQSPQQPSLVLPSRTDSPIAEEASTPLETVKAQSVASSLNRFTTNPFDPTSEHRAVVTAGERWWEGVSDSESVLLTRAREIAANQERILKQQAEILQRTRAQ